MLTSLQFGSCSLNTWCTTNEVSNRPESHIIRRVPKSLHGRQHDHRLNENIPETLYLEDPTLPGMVLQFSNSNSGDTLVPLPIEPADDVPYYQLYLKTTHFDNALQLSTRTTRYAPHESAVGSPAKALVLSVKLGIQTSAKDINIAKEEDSTAVLTYDAVVNNSHCYTIDNIASLDNNYQPT